MGACALKRCQAWSAARPVDPPEGRAQRTGLQRVSGDLDERSLVCADKRRGQLIRHLGEVGAPRSHPQLNRSVGPSFVEKCFRNLLSGVSCTERGLGLLFPVRLPLLHILDDLLFHLGRRGLGDVGGSYSRSTTDWPSCSVDPRRT